MRLFSSNTEARRQWRNGFNILILGHMISNREFYLNLTKCYSGTLLAFSPPLPPIFLALSAHVISEIQQTFFWPLEGKPCMRTVLQRDGAGIPDDFWNYHNCTELALQYFYISKKSIYCLFTPLFWWSLWAANCNLYRYTRIQETGFIKLVRQKKFLVWKVARWQLNIGLREQPSHNIAGQRYLPEKIKW